MDGRTADGGPGTVEERAGGRAGRGTGRDWSDQGRGHGRGGGHRIMKGREGVGG